MDFEVKLCRDSREGTMAFQETSPITGIIAEVDGRLDVYSATSNGFGAQNLTGDLRGTINLIGWIGG